MNDVDLLIFGCAVSFIALLGVYVHVREAFTMRQDRIKRGERVQNASTTTLRKVS